MWLVQKILHKVDISVKSFEIDGFTNTATFKSGVAVKVEHQTQSEVHGSGYVVGTSSGPVGRTSISTSHYSSTKVWLTLEDGSEEYVHIQQDIPIRDGNHLQMMFISGHYVGKVTGYDRKDQPIWERKSNVLLAVRIVESKKAYLCQEIQRAISYEPYYQSFGRLFLWSLLFMPFMGFGLSIWAWLLVRKVLLSFGNTWYGIPQSKSELRWDRIVEGFENLYSDFKNGESLTNSPANTAPVKSNVATPV